MLLLFRIMDADRLSVEEFSSEYWFLLVYRVD